MTAKNPASVTRKINAARKSGATILYLGGTRVADLAPLAGLTSLTALYLSGTRATADQVATLRAAVPNAHIYR